MTTTLSFRNVQVPVYSRIVNFGIRSFSTTADLIDKLPDQDKEWEKVNVFANDQDYLTFVSKLTGASFEDIVNVLNDFKEDERFRIVFARKLDELSSANLAHADDLRFHSLTIYTVVRLLKPKFMIETGVAQGKSSSMALLAMEHNQQGRLISIDLPNPAGELREDGTRTSTGTRPVGWLVPDYLRSRWMLQLGDARDLLPAAVASVKEPLELFLQDSLHTFYHSKLELAAVIDILSGLLLFDNI